MNISISWRVNVDEDRIDREDDKVFKFYLSKWSIFMKEIMTSKLNITDYDELPKIRRLVHNDLTASKVCKLCYKKNPSLARKLIDTSMIFDASTIDLKSYILLIFKITTSELTEELSSDNCSYFYEKS